MRIKISFKSLCVGLVLFLLVFLGCTSKETTSEILPNVIYILADDLGYGDVSFYNPESKIRTPYLDQMAREGMRFTDMHSTSAVCTPTRYSIRSG